MAASVLLACGEHTPTSTDLDPRFAPGGGGPPVKVTATDPSEGEQGQTLTVRVLGSNFEPGAVAEFRLDGVPPGKVRTNSTVYISDGELQADITVEADAELGLYDVEVTTPGGKKGVGTELFRVQAKDNNGNGSPDSQSSPLDMTFDDLSPDGVHNDVADWYVDGQDGFEMFVLTDTRSDQYGDIIFDMGLYEEAPGPRKAHLRVLTADQESLLFEGTVPARGSNGQDGASHRAFIEAGLNDPQPTRFIIYFHSDTHKYAMRYGTECGASEERPSEKATVTLIAENPRVWTIESAGPAIVCRYVIRDRPGRPQPPERIPVYAPFHLTIRER